MDAFPSAKQATLRFLERLDDDASFEDILYGIRVLDKIQRGLKDSEEGRVVPQEEVERMLNQGLK